MQQRIYDFLIACHRVFYLGTVDEGVPDVRPFGAVILHEGKLIFCTGKHKRVYRQMQRNPNVCICACIKGARWLRVSGQVRFVEDERAMRSMLGLEERLREKYGDDGESLALFTIERGRAVFSERGRADEIVEF